MFILSMTYSLFCAQQIMYRLKFYYILTIRQLLKLDSKIYIKHLLIEMFIQINNNNNNKDEQ